MAPADATLHAADARSGSSPAARASTARRRCDQVAEPVAADRRRAGRGRACRVRSSGSRCSPTPTASAGCCSRPTPRRCVGVIAWMHTFSPAKMWIAGLDALRKPLLHLHTQANRRLPWAEIDMDFMNLNQAAHGDREFGYIQTRLGVARKTVAGHVEDPVVRRGRRLGASGARAGARRARCGWPGSATTCATSPSPRATRSRPSSASASRSTATASTTSSTPCDAVADAEVDALVAEYEDHYDVVPELRAGGERHESLRYAARIELGPARLPERRRLRRLHHELRGPRRPAPAARARRAAADGRRLRLRRRGRLEDRGAACAPQGDGRRTARRHLVHGGLHLPPGARAHRRSSARTCWRSARRSRAEPPRCEIHPLGDRRPRGPGPPRLRRRTRPGRRRRPVGPRRPVPAARQRGRRRAARRAAAEAAGRPGGVEAAADLRTSAEAWLMAGGPHHTVLSTALGTEAFADLAEIAAPSCSSSTRTPRPPAAQELRWNQAYYRLAAGL